MATFFLLNAIFWTGMLLISATFRSRGLDRLFATSVLGFTIVALSLILFSALGVLRLSFIGLECVVVVLVGVALRYARDGMRGVRQALHFKLGTHHNVATLTVALISLWAALHYLLYGLVWPVAPISDAPIYHLPFAIRWWKVGALEPIPTPFGEEAATYFPANGDLWLTWLAITSSGGPIIKVGQWPFLALGAVALYALGRQMGGTRWSSVVPASCWCVTPLALTQSAVANVDLIWTAYYFIGVYYFVRFSRRLRRGATARRETLLLGLSLGIVLGTKSIGLLFVPLLLVPAVCRCGGSTLYGAVRAPRFALMYLGLLAAGLVIPSAYWFLRNAWWTGNPLYPLHVAPFGFALLPGWCTRDSMMNSAYHITRWRLDILASRFVVVAGVVPSLLWCGGVLGGMQGMWTRRRPADWMAGGFAVLALIHLVLYWMIIPYNTQERFLLACLGIGMLPLAGWLKRWPSLTPLLILAIAAHLFVIGAGSPGSACVVPLTRNALTLDVVWATAALPLALIVASVLWYRGRLVGRASALLAIVCGSYLYAYPATQALSARPNDRFFPHEGFANRMVNAWLIVERMSGPEANVAYTGTNLPYYLYGSRLRNKVVYIAVNRHSEWLPHDYHRERQRNGNSALSDDPWPQWYRRDMDYSAWLNNLRRADIQLLFVARENQHGRNRVSNGPPPFPIERQWADAHPESFEDLGPPETAPDGIEWARVYRLRPAN